MLTAKREQPQKALSDHAAARQAPRPGEPGPRGVDGPKRSFTRLARLHRSFPKPAIRGIVQKGLTRQGRQCGTFLPFVLDSPMSAFTVANVRGRTNCGQLATLTRSSPRKRPHRCSPSISG
jgi:hypothetical protein